MHVLSLFGQLNADMLLVSLLSTCMFKRLDSIVGYCIMELPMKMSRKLKTVSNAVAWMLTGTNRFHHAVPLLQE